MMKCLYFYFVYHEDELGSSFAFIPAIFLRSIGGMYNKDMTAQKQHDIRR